MNMQTVRGSPEPPSRPRSRNLGLAFLLTSESQPDVMDSKPQSLCSSFSITTANGRKDSKPPSSSPEIGDARPKPPVKPKPCVLPKPAIPVKPMPGQRQTLSEVPSAEKINLLAGPKPYSSGAGNAVKRLSFNLKCSSREVTNGKEVPSSFSTASKSSEDKEGAEPTKKSSAIEKTSEEECRESSSIVRCTLPFKVKPVPVATKPERFPGTTVEEILAKIEKPSESSPSFDRPRLVRSFFSQDGGSTVHLGPKGYVAFRKSFSGEEGVGTNPEGSVYQVSCEIKERSLSRNKELKEEDRNSKVSESQQPETEVKRNEIFLPADSSSQPSRSCKGDQLESSSPPSSPGTKFSSRVTPGSPDAPSETTQPPGAPYLPTDVPCSEALLPPGSPDGSDKSSRSPLVDSVSHIQFADSPVTIADTWPPGSPVKTSPGQSLLSDLAEVSARHPEVPLVPEHTASLIHSPIEYNLQSRQCLTGVSESPGSPSILSKCHVCSDQPPGSPSCIPDTLLNREKDYLKNQAHILPLEDKAPLLTQRRASEGVVQPQGKKMTREELGGSLAALPREKDPSVVQTLGGESSWSLSQSFEWSFPNQGLELGGKRLLSPLNSPIQEHDDDNLLEAELGGEIPPLQGSYQDAGSEGQIGKEEVTEASEHSGNKESERNWKKIEGQLETESTLELSAPGGPSVQRKIGSPNLKDPVVAEEVTLQEDHDDFLQFPPNHEEEALRAMEPLPSVEQSAPPAEPCILFSEGVQVQTADTCQEECDALGMAQEAKMGNSDLLGGVEPNPNSHWLDELLASPPPSADDTKRNTPQVEDPTGPQDLLGWSRKDLHSEFGIVGADHSNTFGLGWTADVTKVKWLGETEQDREFGTGLQDWPNSYTVGNAKGQDMEFGTSQQEWAGGSASPGQEEWLASYGSHCADHPTEESDWSSTYSISAAEGQDAEPYVRKPGWPKLCSAGSDQQSSEFVAVEKTDWNSQYHDDDAETTAWPKYHMENISCPESDISPESAKLPSECTIESQLETELSVKHSDDSTPVSVFSASHLVWPSESDSGSGTSQLQREFSAHQVEQSSEPQNNPEFQLSFQQDSRPDTYGFDDGSYPESKLNVKQSDWPSRCETGIAQNQGDEFSADKPDEVKEYDGEIGCSIEKDSGIKGSNSQMEVDNQQFYAQRPIWSDEYSLNKFEPQEDCFAPGRGDWIKDSNFSETEQNDTTGQDLIPGFGSLGLSDQKVTVNLEESVDNLIHQAGNLMNLSMDEPRGIGEGESECIQHLDIGDLAISSDLKVESLEAYKKPVEKQLDWDLPFGMETSSAASNTRSVNAEGGREPDVGQADLINDMDVSDTKKADVSDLRPKASDGTEVVYRDESHHLEITGLGDDVMQHQGATPVSGERKCHSQRLSSPSCLLEGMVSRSANRPEAQQKRPASFHSCHSEEKRKLNNLPSELVPAAEKIRPSPFPLEDVGEVLSDTDGGISQPNSGNWRQHPEEQSESEATQPISQDDLEGAEALTRENFTFLEDTDVLDNSAHRDRANLGRKRGHRAPITRAGGTVLENDRNSWMFRDSTEPQLVSAVSDEEVHEETKSKKSRSSPLSKGVKVALFPGLSPSALKAKLRGRNRSAEEGEPQGEAKEAAVQRSKSCKMGSASGKPLVLPPKPEKSSGSETSSPNWLQVLKLKKKKS